MTSKSTAYVLATMICAAAIGGGLLAAAAPTTPRFFPDDPLPIDRDTQFDASAAAPRDLGRLADFVLNSFRAPGDARDLPAQNVNTLGEVPDSSWFTNRIGVNALSLDDIVRGPDRVARLDVDQWVIVEGKDVGRQPGFRAINAADPTRTVYQLEFDPPSNPEMATGAEIIGTAIYHAIGYNVVENYLIDLDADKVTIAPDATITIGGRTRPFTRRDLNTLLRGVARKSSGHYRASASRFAEGRYLGPFRYYGTRPDDPNDIFPHEHRRELRGNRVFSAWLNHDDSRAGNSLDMLVGEAGRRFITHYMFDFGSILGSGTNEQDHPWVGSEYVVEPKPGLLTLASFGLWRRPFIAARTPSGLPAAGNFTADRFDPQGWKPHYPNQAFRHMQAEDAFWAARIVAAFTPQAIAAIVAKAEFSDPRVTDHITGTLLRRREIVMRTWLTALNPVASPRVDAGDVLRFDNVAGNAGLVDGSVDYEVTWFSYDNESGVRVPVTDRRLYDGTSVPVPVDALHGADYSSVDIRTLHGDHPAWSDPVRFYFRRVTGGWLPVGIVRGGVDAPGPTGTRGAD
jgi:hypothetical protein